MQLFEVEVYEGYGDTTPTKKVAINPEYIVFIEANGEHAFVHMSNKSVLHTAESKNTILGMINSLSSKKYIG